MVQAILAALREGLEVLVLLVVLRRWELLLVLRLLL